jgi:hypothetical protein
MQWFAGSMAHDESHTFRLADVFDFGRLGAADISIVIQYYPWWWPRWRSLQWSNEFRFFTRVESDGTLSWQTKAVGQ